MLCFIAVNIALFVCLKNYIFENWIWNVLILCVIGCTLAFAIRLLRVKDILYVLKNED